MTTPMPERSRRMTLAEAERIAARINESEDHDHAKCCRHLLCAHPVCCGYYGQP